MKAGFRIKIWQAAGAILLAGGLVWAAGELPGQQKTQRHVANSAAETNANLAQPLAPFRSGEHLDYRVLWSRFAVNAATVQLDVMERRPFYGREAWHFRALAHTVDSMRLLFSLDDQFDSYSAPSELVSLQYEMYLHEQGKNENSVQRMSSERDPGPSRVAQVHVLPGTRDPLALLNYLRSVDWLRGPEVRCPAYDGRNLYEARARLETPSGSVSVPAGTFGAARIGVDVYARGQAEPTARFGVWLAQDAMRTPVLIEAEVPFGSARVELMKARHGN